MAAEEEGLGGKGEDTRKGEEVCTFVAPRRKKMGGGGRMRKRPRGDEANEEDDEGGGLVTGKKGKGKNTGAVGRDGGDEKKSVLVRFDDDGVRRRDARDEATRGNEIDTAQDRDARALREERLRLASERLGAEHAKGGGGEGGEGAIGGVKASEYKGMNAYTDYRAGFRREQNVSGDKASGSHGPLRASGNVRVSYRIDYQPDVCKDYKETGFCGYGDNCKFLHDRSDYKSGWQLEREWEEKEKRRKALLAQGLDEEEEGGGKEEEEDELPFACFICRRPFVDPVVTKCGHYFCEHCALKRNMKNKNCAVCERPTQGIFNVAHDIIKRIKRQAKEEANVCIPVIDK